MAVPAAADAPAPAHKPKRTRATQNLRKGTLKTTTSVAGHVPMLYLEAAVAGFGKAGLQQLVEAGYATCASLAAAAGKSTIGPALRVKRAREKGCAYAGWVSMRMLDEDGETEITCCPNPALPDAPHLTNVSDDFVSNCEHLAQEIATELAKQAGGGE